MKHKPRLKPNSQVCRPGCCT